MKNKILYRKNILIKYFKKSKFFKKLNELISDNKYAKIAILFIIFLCLLFLRRSIQILVPQVWDEDGTVFIPEFINKGWKFLLDPVYGYYITISKIITAVSLTVSFVYYPFFSTVLSWLFIVSVGLAIALSPTSLKGKYLCAMLVFLIPSDPEVFGLPLYTFWWSALLLFLLLFWSKKRKDLLIRLLYLFVGGLSSTIIIIVSPILFLRALIYRKKTEVYIAIVAAIILLIQLSATIGFVTKSYTSLTKIAYYIVPNYFGNFVLGNLYSSWFLLVHFGVLILYFILKYLYKNYRNINLWILLYLLFTIIIVTAVRTDIAGINPKNVGPRYFFYPFIILYWILVQLFYNSKKVKEKLYALAFIVLALLNFIPVVDREKTDNLYWKYNVYKCTYNKQYNIPIQYDGNEYSAWSLNLPGNKCKELISKDLFNKTVIKLKNNEK